MVIPLPTKKQCAFDSTAKVLRRNLSLSKTDINTRIDSLNIVKRGSNLELRKTTHFGVPINNDGLMLINDYIDITVPLKTNKEVSINSSLMSGNFFSDHGGGAFLQDSTTILDPYLCEITDSSPLHNFMDINKYKFNTNKYKNIHDNHTMVHYIDYFEDMMNLPFYEILGQMMGAISLSLSHIPYQLDIKISNKYGIYSETNNLNYLIADSDIMESSTNRITKMLKFIKQLFPEFKNICDREKRNIALFISIDYFDVTLHVKDMNYNITYICKLSVSDLMRVMKTLKYVNDGDDNFFYQGSKRGFEPIVHSYLKDCPEVLEDFHWGLLDVRTDVINVLDFDKVKIGV